MRILLILSIILLTSYLSMGQVAKPVVPTQESEDKIIRLYPNPAVSYITFDFQKTETKGYSIQVYSFLGKKMYETQTVTEKTTISLGEFNRGVYIYHLRDQGGKIIESGKFQVSK